MLSEKRTKTELSGEPPSRGQKIEEEMPKDAEEEWPEEWEKPQESALPREQAQG